MHFVHERRSSPKYRVDGDAEVRKREEREEEERRRRRRDGTEGKPLGAIGTMGQEDCAETCFDLLRK